MNTLKFGLKISSIYLIFLFLILLPYISLAQVAPPEALQPPEIPTSLFGCTEGDSLRRCILKILGQVLRLILVIALALAVLFFAWAGITYITKGTEAGKREQAQNRLLYAVVGLIIAFISWVVLVLLSRFIQSGQI